jgi:hypothetical protein
MDKNLVLTSRWIASNPKCVHGCMWHGWRLRIWWTWLWRDGTKHDSQEHSNPNFNLMHWRLMLLQHCSQLLKHRGANGRRFGWWPYIVNINNYGRVYVGKFCFSLVINYTCMNTSKSKMKKLVKKKMWRKVRVTYCSILSKTP